MDESIELLISRWLDGTASADQVRALDERLRTDGAVRRELLLTADQDAAMRMHLSAVSAVASAEGRPQPARGAALRRWAGATAALLALALGIAYWAAVAGRGGPREPAVVQRDGGGPTPPVEPPRGTVEPPERPFVRDPLRPADRRREPDVLPAAEADRPFERWPHRVRPEPTFEELFPSRLEAVGRAAVEQLFSRQRMTVRLIPGGPEGRAVDLAASATEVEVPAGTRSVRVKGVLYDDVSAVLTPGRLEADGDTDPSESVGLTALSAWAMLEFGLDPDFEPRLAAALDSLLHTWSVPEPGAPPREGEPADPLERGTPATQAAALRAAALAAARSRIGDTALAERIDRALAEAGAEFAAAAVPGGGFGYNLRVRSDAWNIANTHLGVLGLVACGPVPEPVRRRLLTGLLESQNAGGGWGRTPGERSDAASTAEALVALIALLRSGPGSRAGGTDGITAAVGRAVERGLAFFDARRPADETGSALFTTGLLGAALGRKRFAGRDWFRESAEQLLRSRPAGGSRVGAAEIAWNLLFLARGSAPAVINKLRLSTGDDDERRFDAAGAAEWFELTYGGPAAWQTVELNPARSDDLPDAPVLYLSGVRAFALSTEQVELLRRCLDEGSTLLLVAAGDAFAASAFELGRRLYPPERYPERCWSLMGRGHPIYRLAAVGGDDPVRRIPIYDMTDGRRSTVFLVVHDLAAAWNDRDFAGRGECFRLYDAVVAYACDRGPLPARIRPGPTAGEPEHVGAARGTIRVGLVACGSRGTAVLRRAPGADAVQTVGVKADGEAALAAWRSYGEWFRHAAGFELQRAEGVSLAEGGLAEFDALLLSGRHALALTDAEETALKRYIDAGGSVLFDSAGDDFHRSVEALLERLYPGALGPVRAESPLLTGAGIGGFDATEIGLSRAARAGRPNLRRTEDAVRVLTVPTTGGGRRAAAMLSPLELSTALAGRNYFERVGFSPVTARGLAANFLLSARHSRDGRAGRF